MAEDEVIIAHFSYARNDARIRCDHQKFAVLGLLSKQVHQLLLNPTFLACVISVSTRTTQEVTLIFSRTPASASDLLFEDYLLSPAHPAHRYMILCTCGAKLYDADTRLLPFVQFDL